MKYWVGVISSDHVQIGAENGFCAFSHGKRPPVARMSKGDRFVYYSPKTAVMGGTTVQCFTAIGQVVDAEPFRGDGGGFNPWMRRAEYEMYQWLPVRPMLPDLAFVTNPAKWGMAFRRGHFEISKVDFELIETAMKSVRHEQK